MSRVVAGREGRVLCGAAFPRWAMLGSNQRPLPCESSAISFRRFLEFAKSLQTVKFIGVVLFLSFQVVCLGCCTVAAHEARSAGLEPATFSVRSLTTYVLGCSPVSKSWLI